MIFFHPACSENFFQAVSPKGAHTAVCPVTFNAGKISSQMVFFTSRKIFQSIFIFNGNENSATFRQVRQKQFQKILIGRPSSDITLSVLKDTDQADIVEISWQIRLYILKIPYMDCNVITASMPVRVDQTSLFG